MPPPQTTVIVADIEDRWRPLSAAERQVASSLLVDAWAVLVSHDPTIATRITAATLDPALLRTVLVAMVLRVMRNPEGKRQESIDDYSWTLDSAVSTGALYVSADELRLLAAPYTGTTRGSLRLVAYGEL